MTPIRTSFGHRQSTDSRPIVGVRTTDDIPMRPTDSDTDSHRRSVPTQERRSIYAWRAGASVGRLYVARVRTVILISNSRGYAMQVRLHHGSTCAKIQSVKYDCWAAHHNRQRVVKRQLRKAHNAELLFGGDLRCVPFLFHLRRIP